jgi:hypothetical protein
MEKSHLQDYQYPIQVMQKGIPIDFLTRPPLPMIVAVDPRIKCKMSLATLAKSLTQHRANLI